MKLTVIGGGLCGLIVATRWLQSDRDGSRSVQVIEPAGEANSRQRDRPAAWLSRLGSADDWRYRCEANAALAGRQLNCPRGRGLGGSGRLNAMIWHPPTTEDFASLTAAGLPPERLRRSLEVAIGLVKPERPRWLSDVARAAIQSDDNGFGVQPYRRMTRNGRRWTAERLIDPADIKSGRFLRIPNVVGRVSFHRRRVTSATLAGGRRLPIDGPVVLAAGTIGTPAVLLRSGLAAAGVGENLHDHLTMPVVYRTIADHAPRVTTAAISRFENAATGPLTSNLAECGGLSADRRFQLHVTPTDYLRYPAAGSALSVAVNATGPRSRGRVCLQGEALQIDPGYLRDAEDLVDLIEGVRHVRRWVQESPLRRLLESETRPGSRRQDDRSLGKSIARYAQTLYHPGGTCVLGGPIDSDYRFDDLDNLWVVDASLLPRPTFGNPSAVLAALAVDATDRLPCQSTGSC